MKCEIQWIDDSGFATPDDNDAVAIACVTFYDKLDGHITEQRRYPICENHLKRMPKETGCWANGIKISEWTVEDLPEDTKEVAILSSLLGKIAKRLEGLNMHDMTINERQLVSLLIRNGYGGYDDNNDYVC